MTKIVMEQNGEKVELTEQEAYKKVQEINKDPNKSAKVENGQVIVRDVLRG